MHALLSIVPRGFALLRWRLFESPLAGLVWGARPPSRRRRWAARRELFGPLALFFALLFALNWWGLPFGTFQDLETLSAAWAARDLSIMFDDGAAFVWNYISGLLVTILLIFSRAAGSRRPRMLNANRHDYLLMGLRGPEMLQGLAAPGLIGVCLVSAVMCVFHVAHLWIIRDFATEFGAFRLYLFMGGAISVNLLLCVWIDVGFWAIAPSPLIRVTVALAFGFALSPGTVGIILNSLLIVIVGGDGVRKLLCLEAAGWVVRAWIVWLVWRRAAARIEGG